MQHALSYEYLKLRQRKLRDGFPESLSLRTHRALSWLGRAEKEGADYDAQFLFLWIAFNAAYANEIYDRRGFSEMRLLTQFLHRLIESDKDGLLYQTMWQQFPKSIRLLITNKYVFQPFWDYHNGLIDESDWHARFRRSQSSATRALGRMDTKRVISTVFDRLYVLRNQIVHGGATWNSGVNRSQVSDGAKIMGVIVPIIIELMMNHPNQWWGDACYPVVS